MLRVTPLAFALLGALGCKTSGSIRDPFQDALHMPRPGHSLPTDDGVATTTLDEPSPTRGKPTPGRYGGDLDDLERVIEGRWAARGRHEELDDVDLDAAFTKLRKDVGRSTTRPELAIALREMLCRLGDGHLRLVDSSYDARTLDSGLHVDVVGGAFVVTSVDDRYGGERFVPKRGDVVVKTDGVPVGELAARECLRPGSTPAQREHLVAESLARQSRGPDETPRPEVLLLGRKGRTHKITLKWRAPPGGEPPPCVHGSKPAPRVGRLDVDSLACADLATFQGQLEQAMGTIGDARDIVVDLRRNGGGDDAQAREAAGYFVRAPTTWMRFRHADAPAGAGFSDDPFTPTPGHVVGAERIWVLTGPGCFSTCEIFASVLATQPNVTLVGEPTAGGVGNPEPYRMSRSGMVVMVPKTLYALPGTDSPIEGAGVPVDVEVRATIDDAAAGRDAVLEAVLARIRGQD